MNLWKKGSVLLLLTVFMVGMLGSPVSAGKKSSDLANTGMNELMNELTKEQKELSILIEEHTEGYTDANGDLQMSLKNKDKLKNKLSSSNLDKMISYDELEESIAQINSSISDGKTGNEVGVYALSCGSLTTILGWVHAGNYALAAVALGITGFGAAIPAILIGGVWTAASVIGCNI